MPWIIAGAALLVAGGAAVGLYEAGSGVGQAAQDFGGGLSEGADQAENTVASGTSLAIVLVGAAVLLVAYHKTK
jgi:hypothetical protein